MRSKPITIYILNLSNYEKPSLKLFDIKCRSVSKWLEGSCVNLNQFFRIFYKEFGQGSSLPDYFIELVGTFIREPVTHKERVLDQVDKFNPLNDEQLVKRSTISSWLNRNGGKVRNMGRAVAERIYALRDTDKFQQYFENNASIEQCRSVLKQLRNFHFSADEDDCFKISSHIFEKIIEFRTKKKNDVNPEDIELTSFVQDTDIFFLREVGNRCPLCHKLLIKKKNGKNVPQYRITSIFPYWLDQDILGSFEIIKKAPKELDADDNKISLCLNCANSYEKAPEIDEYSKLLKIKKEAINSFDLENQLIGINLEHEVAQVVEKIANLHQQSTDDIDLVMNPVSVKEKLPQNYLLQREITNQVQYYYNIINREFINLSRTDGIEFDEVCEEVRFAFIKVKKFKETKEEQFEAMVDWMQQTLGFYDDRRLACKCVTSFFVQNCEVFEQNAIA